MIGGLRCRWHSTLRGLKTELPPARGGELIGVGDRHALSRDEPATAEELTFAIAEAIQTAEELALTSVARGDASQSEIISERLTPNLMQAKMYAEIAPCGAGLDHSSAPEIRNGIAEATAVASDLADIDAKYSPLLSTLRRLREAVSRLIN